MAFLNAAVYWVGGSGRSHFTFLSALQTRLAREAADGNVSFQVFDLQET